MVLTFLDWQNSQFSSIVLNVFLTENLIQSFSFAQVFQWEPCWHEQIAKIP